MGWDLYHLQNVYSKQLIKVINVICWHNSLTAPIFKPYLALIVETGQHAHPQFDIILLYGIC